MNLRERCQKIYQTTCQWGYLPVRALAQATKLSKSSVHRLSRRIKGRQNHPESPLWETSEGFEWLRLLVFATIYVFGIKHGIGSEALSEFFELLRLKSQIGISPTALRRLEAQIRSQVLNYGEQQHQQIKSTQTKLEIVAGADETFFSGFDGIILVENKIQNGTNIAVKMKEILPKIMVLGEKYQLNSTEKALSQFESQINGIAIAIDLWWQNITKSLFLEEVDSLTQNWILTCLLPEVYWFSMVSKTKNRDLKKIYQKSWFQAHQKLLKDSFTQKMKRKEINQWRGWSNLMVSKFQRASSAIEGRNGKLWSLHHSGRGLSEKDLQVLTIIHNYDLHRTDGSTAAQRFFGRTFPPLFSWVFEQMGELPALLKPRKFQNVHTLVA